MPPPGVLYALYILFISSCVADEECSAGRISTEGIDLGSNSRFKTNLLDGNVYINTNQVATCNGTVYGWSYCFDAFNNRNRETRDLTIAVYRPYPNGSYLLVEGSVYEYRHGRDTSFTCGNITLQPSEQFVVQEKDVVGICDEDDNVFYYANPASSSLLVWDARGCSDLSSSSGITSTVVGTFLLSALIEELEERKPEEGLGSGAVAAIVIIVLIVVGGAAAVGIVIGVFLFYKRKQDSLRVGRSYDNKTYSSPGQPKTVGEGGGKDHTQQEHTSHGTENVYQHYEMSNGDHPGHEYEMGNLERLVTAVDYPPVHEAEPHSAEGIQEYYSSIMHKAIEENIYESLTPYEVPAEREDDLYQQIQSYHIKTIRRNHIKMVSHLGTGEFGTVSKGEWTNERRTVEVAVKTLTDSANTIKFLQEAAIMAQFRHPNVITLHGVVSQGTPKMMVLDLMNKGDLHHFLNSLRESSGPKHPKMLLNFSKHVSLGLHYLSSTGFVHRDLAARNILVSKNNILKIADFGMSRDLAEDDIYVSRGGMIPVRWTALEALLQKCYSTASDVWSYGCVLYEIWSLGHKPFENAQTKEIIRLLKRGYRLPPPPGCPRVIYHLMVKCWNPDVAGRIQPRAVLKGLLVNEVLAIPPEDIPADRQAAVLGAPLDRATQLYQDLQNTYTQRT